MAPLLQFKRSMGKAVLQTSSTSFGIKAELPTVPRWDDVLGDKGAAASKPCLSPVEMRTPTAAGGLLPSDEDHFFPTTFFLDPR